jgi:Phosphotransferase enzyme family
VHQGWRFLLTVNPRTVTLELCGSDGVVLGELPSFDVALPWFQEVESLVTAVRLQFGIDVVVLRVLRHGPQAPVGGPVRYLAELVSGTTPNALRACDPSSDDRDVRRLSYAKPGGWRLDLEWADEVLRSTGHPRLGPARQMRTWNLSCIWQIPTISGLVWLKVVPGFFAHEGSLIARLPVGVGPVLLASDGPRVLLADIDGGDLWNADVSVLCSAMTALVHLQADWFDRTAELVSLGAPDWSALAFPPMAADVLTRHGHELTSAERYACWQLVDALPERFDSLAECGLPDTLVHGDLNPGNVFFNGATMTILDWGDAGVGHPVLDVPAMTRDLDAAGASVLRSRWVSTWRSAVPSSDPERALALGRPLAALRQAVIYRGFLDNIEKTEHVYHRGDPARWLRAAADT